MTRNPFGVPDVPDSSGEDVIAFARGVRLAGSTGEGASSASADPCVAAPAWLEGDWSSRWNADGSGWHEGRGRLSVETNRVYILFNWDNGTKWGLIEACWDGRERLVGRYLNLSAPEITRPWVGVVVDAARIDGEHSRGRIDFRR